MELVPAGIDRAAGTATGVPLTVARLRQGAQIARIAAAILGGGVLWLAWIVARGGLYKPGDDIGYGMGLIGTLFLLPLLAYPLRKRVAMLWSIGSMRAWVHWHLVAGRLGVVLLLFHATFGARSPVGMAALWAMAAASVSGLLAHFLGRRRALPSALGGRGNPGSTIRHLNALIEWSASIPWSRIHIPAVLLFALSGLLHVIAVHRY